jgi:hypothetical protein
VVKVSLGPALSRLVNAGTLVKLDTMSS